MRHFIELTECEKGVAKTVTRGWGTACVYGYRWAHPLAIAWDKIETTSPYNRVDIYDKVFPRTLIHMKGREYAVLESLAQIEAKIAAAKKEK